MTTNQPGQDILNNICGQICGSDIQLPQGGRLVPLRRHHLVQNRNLKPAFFFPFFIFRTHMLSNKASLLKHETGQVFTPVVGKIDRFVNLINMNEDVTD